MRRIPTFFILFSLIFTGCGGPHFRILLPEGRGIKEEAEIFDALDFFAEKRRADYMRLMDGLTIEVVDEVIMGKYAGTYEPEIKHLTVTWKDGIGFNSFFHELLHHHLHIITDQGDYVGSGMGRHSERFLDEERKLNKEWKEITCVELEEE